MSFSRMSAVAGCVSVLTALTMIGTAQAVPSSTSASQSLVRAAVSGQPPRNYYPPAGSHFAFPNRGALAKMAIRNRVLFAIQGVWGGTRDRYALPLAGNGRIRIATWSFDDWDIAKALVAAHRRGASVQVIGARSRNSDSNSWRWLKRSLGSRYYKPGVPGSSERVSFTRDCAGACRGRGGTPHAKYFLFDNVGYAHKRHIVFQTSMNLTRFGFNGQWNEAQVVYSPYVYDRFMRVYREARIGRPNVAPYRRYPVGQVTSIFFPGANASRDPAMQMLNQTRCTGATSGGNSAGRTRIRIVQYAMYDPRGLALAKKLRSLWNAGCDIQMIYSLSTRPVMAILRNRSGRGPIPVKQSVIRNRRGEIVKYNHSKWMTITGSYGSSRGAWMTLTGSANWSSIAFSSDEQMMEINNYGVAHAHMLNFITTWRQKTSRNPSFRGGGSEARGLPAGNTIPFGRGEYRYLNPYGD